MSGSVDTTNGSAASPESALQPWRGEVRHIARQPILDLNGNAHGYELLFQMPTDGPIIENEIEASRTILDDMVLFGLDKLAGGLPAFVSCTAEAITEQLVAVLPPALTVLEISQRVPVTPKFLTTCRELAKLGFRFALVDCIHDSALHPLMDLVKYVRVDFSRLDPLGHERLHRRLEGTAVAMIASKVHTQTAYKEAREEGFTLFQGYYFCHPELVHSTKVPANRAAHIEILRQLFQNPLNLKTLSPLVMRDAALVYRLLRLVNSPAYAIRQAVNSVEAAIVILGENTFRRIATLAIQCELNADQPPEILTMALVRARFCELGSRLAKLDPNEQYLLGMLSLLPAMLRLSMETIVAELPLRQEIRNALLGSNTRERSLLSWIEAHERNMLAEGYKVSQAFGLNEASLDQFYIDALMWNPSRNGVAV